VPSLLRTDKEITEIYERHINTVWRVCYSFMKNRVDTEDSVQETFLRLISSGKEFQSESHERAWLIVTASNLCRDSLKHWWRRREDIDDHRELAEELPVREGRVLSAIMALPDDYKTAVYMHYYEGYTAAEIAEFSGCAQSTVRSRLARARKLLRKTIGGEFDVG